MNCSNCDATISVDTDTHLLNCAFCGAVLRNPEAAERRPIDDLLDKVFAETGDAAFATRESESDVGTAASGTIAAVDGRRYATMDKSTPDALQARRDTRKALSDVFGNEPAITPSAAAVDTTPALALEDAPASTPPADPLADPVPSTPLDASPVMGAPQGFVEPETPRRTSRPQVILGGDNGENPEWTRLLVPMLAVALLAGAGVAGLAALILG